MSRRHAALHAGRWARVRRAVFERDGWRCVLCGRASRLECDHVVPLHRAPDQDAYDLDGLQTLCRTCHVEKTRGENRREPIARQRRNGGILLRKCWTGRSLLRRSAQHHVSQLLSPHFLLALRSQSCQILTLLNGSNREQRHDASPENRDAA